MLDLMRWQRGFPKPQLSWMQGRRGKGAFYSTATGGGMGKNTEGELA
jgi:hypothetical protein